jgi:hypothetical protein
MRDNQTANGSFGSNAFLCDRYYGEIIESVLDRLDSVTEMSLPPPEKPLVLKELELPKEKTPAVTRKETTRQLLAEWPKDAEAEDQNNFPGSQSSERMGRAAESVLDVHSKEDQKKKNFLTKVPSKIAFKTMSKSTKNVETPTQKGVPGNLKLLSQKKRMNGSQNIRGLPTIEDENPPKRPEVEELERVRVASKFVIGLAHKSKIPVILPPEEPVNLAKAQQIRERAKQIRRVRKMAERASSQAIQVIKSTFEDKVRKLSAEVAQRESRKDEQALAVLRHRSIPYNPEEMVS